MSVEVEGKYVVDKQIGEGRFGKVFSAQNKNTGETVVIKVDNKDSIILRNEASIYRLLQGINGIPKLRSYGNEGNYNYMVIDKLDKSLKDLKSSIKKPFDLKTTLSMGLQMLRRVEGLHNEHIIHRDIKPENFVMGDREDKHEHLLYIIDFGLSKLYKVGGEHIACKTDRTPIGTLDYMSLNVHKGLTPSRRDDLESIGYTLLYLMNGGLPWMVEEEEDEDNSGRLERKVYEIKRKTDIWGLNKDIPGELALFVQYCRNLEFGERPNYGYLRMLFANVYKLHNFGIDNKFSWNT